MGLRKTDKEKKAAAAQRKKNRQWVGKQWKKLTKGATPESKGIVTSAIGRKKFVDKTKDSPAAKGGFDAKERLKIREKHQEFLKKRKEGTHRKKRLTNAQKLKQRMGKK